jgi:hypothetical protein
MNITLRYLFFAVSNIFICSYIGQIHFNCGTEISEKEKREHQYFIEKIKDIKVTITDSIVPVKFHFISYSDSSETMDSAMAFSSLSVNGEYFNNAGIIFKHCGNIDYIYNTEFADFERLEDEVICNERDFPNLLNIYFCPALFRNENGLTIPLCAYTYLNGTKNRLFIRNSCSENSSSLAHELGHYFSLLHTHEVMFGQEYVNGINCYETGDLLCGTPADPGLNVNNTISNCTYVGQELDPLGFNYSPNTNNIMSYNPDKFCRNEFSFDQLQQMNNFFRYNSNALHCIDETDISSLLNSFDFILFPNPVGNFLAITINLPIEAIVEVSIMDVFGKIITNKTISNFSYVSVSELSIGPYFLSIKHNQQVVTKKFIKA